MSLDYSIPLTRVNGALMQQNLKKQAHLMGFAKSLEGGGKLLKVRTTDDQFVMAALAKPWGEEFVEGILVEIEGTIESKNKIAVSVIHKWKLEASKGFDAGVYNEYLALIQGEDEYITEFDESEHFGEGGREDPNVFPREVQDEDEPAINNASDTFYDDL